MEVQPDNLVLDKGDTIMEPNELDQAKHLLQKACSDIRMLRDQVNFLQPKAEAWDVMSKVVQNMPNAPKGYGVDVRWEIENFLQPSIPVEESE
jgi:hypothetical protein